MDLLSWLLAGLRLALGAVFLISAVGKARAPRRFAAVVASYRLLPRAWVRPLSLLLIGAEAVMAVLLLAGWRSQAVAASCALLLVVFILAVGINLMRGRQDLECGCFGAKVAHKISLRHIAGQSALLAMALCVAFWGGGRPSWHDVGFIRWNLAAAQHALPLALALAGLWLLFRLMWQLHRLLGLWHPGEE